MSHQRECVFCFYPVEALLFNNTSLISGRTDVSEALVEKPPSKKRDGYTKRTLAHARQQIMAEKVDYLDNKGLKLLKHFFSSAKINHKMGARVERSIVLEPNLFYVVCMYCMYIHSYTIQLRFSVA